jgi:hypothetical protein
MKHKIYLGLALLGLSFASCNISDLADTKLAPISPEWAIPLVDDTLRVEDITAKSVDINAVKNFDNGLYYFIYTSEILGPSLEEAVRIKDTTVNFSNRQVFPALSAGQTLTLPQQSLDINISNLVLRELLLKGGRLGLRVNLINGSGTRVSTNVVYRFDSIRNANAPLSISSFFGNLSSESLVNYRFTNKGSNSVSKFYVTPTITVNQALPSGNYTIEASLVLTGLRFSFADIIANNLIPLQPITKDIRIKLFDSRYEDDKNDIRFEDPSLQLIVANGFGGDPIDLRITNIKSFSDDRSIFRRLTGAGVTALANQRLQSATINYAAPSVTRSGIFSDTLDRTNTNINDIIQFYNPAPKFVSFDARAVTQNFSTRITGADTSRLRLRTNALLPTDGVANSYALSDTFDLKDLPKNNVDQTVEEASFKLVFYNQFPVNMVGNLLFLDVNNNIIDSLVVKETNGTFNNVLAIAARPGPAPEYRVPASSATKNERLFVVSKTRYDNIQSKAVKGILLAKLTSYSDPGNATRPRARIYSDYATRIKVGVSAKVTINL